MIFFFYKIRFKKTYEWKKVSFNSCLDNNNNNKNPFRLWGTEVVNLGFFNLWESGMRIV